MRRAEQESQTRSKSRRGVTSTETQGGDKTAVRAPKGARVQRRRFRPLWQTAAIVSFCHLVSPRAKAPGLSCIYAKIKL